jgi:hypothetical protein
MRTGTFFDESTEQSRIKATIVRDYFWAWANVILSTVRKRGGCIAYIDLFAGPGRYKDGTKSTPLLVLETAIADPNMRGHIVTLFNDADGENAAALQREIDALPGIKKLKYQPQVEAEEVGDNIVALFEKKNLIPTFFFEGLAEKISGELPNHEKFKCIDSAWLNAQRSIIIRLLNKIVPQESGEQLGLRHQIDEGKKAGTLPAKVASYMQMLLTFRNSATYEDRLLDLAESLIARIAADEIVSWQNQASQRKR